MLLTPSMVLAVARRPHLWSTAARAYRSMVPDRWWSRRPYLPVPDLDWMRFRLVTAYGGTGDAPPGSEDDLLAWLAWMQDTSFTLR